MTAAQVMPQQTTTDTSRHDGEDGGTRVAEENVVTAAEGTTVNGRRAETITLLPLFHDHSDAKLLGGQRRDGMTNDAAERAHRSLPVLLARELTRYLRVVDRRVNYMQPDLLASYRFFTRPVSGAAGICGSGGSVNGAPGSRGGSTTSTGTRRRRSAADRRSTTTAETKTTTTTTTNSARTRPYAKRQNRT